MREILFRGKTLDTGKWIEGSIVRVSDGYIISTGVGKITYVLFGLNMLRFIGDYVSPDSVGQCTGLIDKKGKRIFEGDICKICNLEYKVEFKYSQWQFKILSNKVYCYPAFNSHCGEYCEVIGNIYDNPELVEGHD